MEWAKRGGARAGLKASWWKRERYTRVTREGKSEEIKEEGKQLMTFVIYTRRSHTPSIMCCALFDRLFDTVVVRTYVLSPVIPPLWETRHSHSLYVDSHPNGQCRL